MIQSYVCRARSRGDAVRAFFATLALSATLAACSGGGGPGAALVIQASASSTNASGQSITLTATIQNSTATDTPTWSLSGPGSLSATSGASVTYLPPDSEADANDGAATATVTATAGSLSKQFPITLVAKAFPGHHWTQAAAPVTQWYTVSYGNGQFVAAGSDGTIASSADGTTWSRHDTTGGESWESATYTPTGWWLFDTNFNALRTSVDGLTWTSKPLPAAAANLGITRLAYANGIYLMLGVTGGSVVSTDGVTWTPSSVSGREVAYGDGVFVVRGSAGVYWSADAVNWTKTTVPATQENLGFNNGQFVTTSGTEVWTSADGKTWALAGAPSVSLGGIRQLVSYGNTLYAVGISGVFGSTDYVHWTAVSLPLSGPNGLAQGGGKVVVVANSGAIAVGADLAQLSTVVAPSTGYLNSGLYAHGRYIWTTDQGLLSSTDGSTWTASAFAPGNGLAFGRRNFTSPCNGMAAAPDGTIVVAGTFSQVAAPNQPQTAAFAWSSDGVGWNFSTPQGTTPSRDFDSGPVIHDGTRFLSIGSRTGFIRTSPDGHTWTNVGTLTLPTAVGISGLAYGNGKYVLVGSSGLAATSSDGLHWTIGAQVASPGPSSNLLGAACVVWTGSKFVAAGDDAIAATSSDGVTWTAAATAAPAPTPDQIPARINDLAINADGEIVAVGYNGLVETSRDGVHWTLRNPGRPEQFTAVAVTPTGFMAGSDTETVLFSTN